MRFFTTLTAFAVLATDAFAHSWVGCTDHDNTEILTWMEGNATMNPPRVVDPLGPWYSYFCKGWPRAKKNPGDWIDESSNYAWDIAGNKWSSGDTHACHPDQRSPNYNQDAPMASAQPGGSVRLLFGGNGHSRGHDTGGSPGTVAVYWKGTPEAEITDVKEFTEQNKLQENGFSDESFAYPGDPSIQNAAQGLVDKGNWQTLKIPENTQPGRYMFVWVWSYDLNGEGPAPRWSTCFDIMIG